MVSTKRSWIIDGIIDTILPAGFWKAYKASKTGKELSQIANDPSNKVNRGMLVNLLLNFCCCGLYNTILYYRLGSLIEYCGIQRHVKTKSNGGLLVLLSALSCGGYGSVIGSWFANKVLWGSREAELYKDYKDVILLVAEIVLYLVTFVVNSALYYFIDSDMNTLGRAVNAGGGLMSKKEAKYDRKLSELEAKSELKQKQILAKAAIANNTADAQMQAAGARAKIAIAKSAEQQIKAKAAQASVASTVDAGTAIIKGTVKGIKGDAGIQDLKKLSEDLNSGANVSYVQDNAMQVPQITQNDDTDGQ